MIEYDPVLLEIADYVDGYVVEREAASRDGAPLPARQHRAARSKRSIMPACMRLLGPPVPGVTVEHGARVPGTSFVLDPVTAAFNIGAMLRWTDFSDTFITLTTMHPSDDVGADTRRSPIT